MSEEIKKKYEEAASAQTFTHDGYLGFLAGAADADKEGYNRAIEDIVTHLNKHVALGWLERDWINLKAELEKLKKP